MNWVGIDDDADDAGITSVDDDVADSCQSDDDGGVLSLLPVVGQEYI